MSLRGWICAGFVTDAGRSRGKVFLFTGILPFMKDEDGMAAVLGHEISHIVAKHPDERTSRGFIIGGIVILLASLFDVSGQFSNFLLSLGYEMPNTRVQEVSCLQRLDSDPNTGRR